MQSQPGTNPSQTELMHFASSELLKIKTAYWPKAKQKRALRVFV
jgi:hypothetical protein